MPDEVRTFPKGKVELVKVGGGLIGRGTFEPVVVVDFQGKVDYAKAK